MSTSEYSPPSLSPNVRLEETVSATKKSTQKEVGCVCVCLFIMEAVSNLRSYFHTPNGRSPNHSAK